MKLYLSLGRVWTGTMNDARDAQGGKDYEHVEVPTDKPGLIAWLNARWAELLDDDTHSYDDEREKANADPVASEPAANPTDCPACHRSPRVAQIVVNCEASMTAQAAIADVTDTRSLDRIIAVAVARRAEL